MGISKHLKARLARLEASVASLPDLQAERERERVELCYTAKRGLMEAPMRTFRRKTVMRACGRPTVGTAMCC